MNTFAVESVGMKIRLLVSVLSSSSLARSSVASVSRHDIPGAQNIDITLVNLVWCLTLAQNGIC